MKCARCFTENPEPFEAGGEGEPSVMAYWLVVFGEGEPVITGVEENGEIGFRFAVCPELDPKPNPDNPAQFYCNNCFCLEFPMDGEEPSQEGPR